jgi:hypothetical protein
MTRTDSRLALLVARCEEYLLHCRQVAAHRVAPPLRRLGVLRLAADPVVDCAAQLLLGPKVTLRGLDRDVTEQELDLI